MTRTEKTARFRALHATGCFIIPNPWDIGSARIMEAVGFSALATTSSGYAFAQGQRDGIGAISRDESLAYAARIAAATDLPVSADLEDGYADTPQGVAETVRLAAEAGLSGLSIEDSAPGGPDPFRSHDDAIARIAAAVEAARRHDIVLTARADGLTKNAYDLGEAISRLRAFEALGAEVLYAPGLPDLQSLKTLCNAVTAPVNHVIGQGLAGVSLHEIAATGVRRISLGGSLARAAHGALRQLGQSIATGDFSALDTAPKWTDLTADQPDRHP